MPSLAVRDSIIDATGADRDAVFVSGDHVAALAAENTTVIGRIAVTQVGVIANSILLASPAGGNGTLSVDVDRAQVGCVRYSFVPPDAKVPRRYRCVPKSGDDAERMRPVFCSLRYGSPSYCQLDRRTPIEIVNGAEDDAEMGVYRSLQARIRESNLRVRLDEYLRFGMEAGIFHAS